MKINENIITKQLATLANGSGFGTYSGSTMTAKSVNMSADWGVSDATEYAVKGGSHTLVLIKSHSGFARGMLTYQILVKNTGDKPFDIRVGGVVAVDGVDIPALPPVTIAPGESRLFSRSGYRRLSYDFLQVAINTKTIGDQIKLVMAREMVQVGEFPSGVWTPPHADLNPAQIATLPPYGEFKEILPL